MKLGVLLSSSLLCSVAGLSTVWTCSASKGKMFNFAAMDKSASDGNCCTPLVASCTRVIDGDALRSYACLAGTELRSEFGTNNVSQANCCQEKTCMSFDCAENTKLINAASLFTEPDQTKCCEAIPCRVLEYACPEDKTPDPTATECCGTFVPSCLTNTKYTMIYPYDLFPCKADTTLNVTDEHYLSANPSQDVCCEPFVPTCEFNSGSILSPKPWTCADGSSYKNADKDYAVGSLDASEANCCEVHNATCQDATPDGRIFQCPGGKVYKEIKGPETASEDVCCMYPTCSIAVSKTCEIQIAMEPEYCGGNLEPNLEVSNVQVGNRDNKNKPICCQSKPYSINLDDSGASTVGGGIFIGSFFVLALAL